MAREKAKSKAFGEGVIEVPPAREKRPETFREKSKPISFDVVRKVIPKFEEGLKDALEAIHGASAQSKEGLTQALMKDLERQLLEGKQVLDAYFLARQTELARLQGSAPSAALSSREEAIPVHLRSKDVGSLRPADMQTVIPGFERIFQDNLRAISAVVGQRTPEQAGRFIDARVRIVEREFQETKAMVDAYIAASLADVMRRRLGSIIVDQPASELHKKAASLLREQVPQTAPLGVETAPLSSKEQKIDSDIIALEKLIATLGAAVVAGPKVGKGFVKDIQATYKLFEEAVGFYFQLRNDARENYRGQQLNNVLVTLESDGLSLKKLVGGIKSLMVLSESMEKEIGTANMPLVEKVLRELKEDLDQKWADIGMTVGAVPTQWSGSRRLTPNPKTGK